MVNTDTRDLVVIPTSPFGIDSHVSPFDLDAPEELVFCCLFRSVEDRTDFLARLKTIAREPLDSSDDIQEVRDALEREYLQAIGSAGEAFFAVARWWIAAKRHTYHSYSLRIGAGPYRTSCVISFRPLSPQMIRNAFETAASTLIVEKARVLDSFGFAGLD